VKKKKKSNAKYGTINVKKFKNGFEPNADDILMPNGNKRKKIGSKNKIITKIDGRIVTFEISNFNILID